MSTTHFDTLLEYVRDRHPRSLRGIQEARAVSPARFDEIAEMYLGWLLAARGPDAIQPAVEAFVGFTAEVNIAQCHYEADGHYANKSFAEVYENHYSQNETMSDYLWGIYLTNFLWAHHLEICLFFRDTVISKFSEAAQLVEIAPGHGGWGAWALHCLPRARLRGFDISPESINIANSVSKAAGIHDRTSYEERNCLDLGQVEPEIADGLICSFLVEHLEQPAQLFRVINHLLKPHSFGFVTGALTAAQVDHIFEFRYESELIRLCEENGLRVVASLSVGPKRTFPKANFLPRSMALLVQKRIHDTF